MKKIIKYFAMFLLALVIMSASRWNVNAEEANRWARRWNNRTCINDNSPLTDEQILWVKQYLSQYVDENIVETIVSIISALAIIGVIAFSLIKLVKTVNGGFKTKNTRDIDI